MLDIGGDELVLTAIVAIIVIGPKDLPRAMRLAGGWVGKARRMSGAFRAGVTNFVRESEIRDLETDWATKRQAILARYSALEDKSATMPFNDSEKILPDQSIYGTIQSPSAEMPPISDGSSLTT